MIEVIGVPGSSEYRAAVKVREAFEDFLGPENSRRSDVRIVVSAKTYGERRQDIDLVVIGQLSKPMPLPKSLIISRQALLLSFFLTIEVKDHPPSKVKFSGAKAFVTYKDGQGDASEQSEGQKYSAKSYIEKHGLDAPFIVSLLLFTNIPTDKLPLGRHNLLGGDFSASELLDAMYLSYEGRINDKQSLIQAFGQGKQARYLDVANIFTRQLEATPLDRKKIDLIARQKFDQGYAKTELGKQLLIFSGPGGTGKTVKLLQLAHYMYQERGERALILTYNLALVSDIRRLMALMGMNDDVASATVKIASVHSFMYQVLCDAGIFVRGANGFLARYEEMKGELLGVAGAIQKSDFEYWDYVLVDEAQDWPENERDIIYALYGVPKVIVADGRAQLIRNTSHCDWTRQKSIVSQTVTLSKSLRLKHDLCTFVTSLIDELSIPDWKMTADVSVYGGRIIVAIGDLTADRELTDKVIKEAKAAGNAEVDLFFCVPPSMVAPKAGGAEGEAAEKFSTLSQTLVGWGYNVWDGVDEVQRHSYATKIDQLRIVQYDSCRGLEGWSVFNFALDELYDYKRASFKPSASQQADLFFDADAAADAYAKKWLAIPLTRAIDTLVINIRDPGHWLCDVFLKAAKGNKAVEIHICSDTVDFV